MEEQLYMKRKTTTKLLSCLLSLLMVVGLLSAMGIPAYAAGAAWDADQTFDSDSMIRGGVTVSDNIELTINEGVTVTVYGGIDARGKTLTVSGSGTLIVYGANAFIGNMTVNNDYAKVYAYGGTGGNGADRPDDIDSFSGTPGGNGGTGGTAIMGNVTVFRGTVTVIGGRGGNGGRGADVYSADTGRGFGRTAGVGGNGGTGGTGIKGDVTVFSGTVNATGGIGGTGGEGGFAWGGTNGKGGNGANGGVAVDGTVTVNGGNVYMASDNGGEGGINGRDPYGDKIKTGADGNLGRAVTGAIGNDSAEISESNDNEHWSVISSSSSEKPYVHVITSVSVTEVVLDKTSAAVDEGSALALTAVLLYGPANNRVKWSVDSEGVDKVLLYADAECSNVIGSDETETLKVYVKGRLPGTAKVTVTSVADSSLSATCDITVRHIHDFNYFVSSDDTITARCKSDHCPEKQGDMQYSETLTIVPPTAQPVYDGTAYPATFADGKTAFGEFTTLPAIEYRRYTEQAVWSLVDAPIDAGRYRASITLQPASDAQITAWVEYTIDTAAMDVSVAGWEGTYDGDEHAITVTVNVPEGTQIAYRIADSGEYDLTENPNFTDAGTHKVYYRVTNPNYTAVEGDGTVQIDKATLTDVMVIPLGDLTYTGQEQTQKVFTNAKSVNRQPVAFTYSKTPDGPFGVMPTVTNVSDSGTYYYMASAPNHHDVTGSFTVTMQKYKVPQVTAPTLSPVTYDPNRTLSHISLPTNWAWANDSTVPTVENTGYDAALTVDDANNDYTEIEGYDPASHSVTRTLRLTVNKTEVTPPVILGKPYTGERQFADVSDTEFYTVTKNEGGITVGRYDVVLTLKDSANYRWTTSNEASITLDFRIEYIIVPTANPVTYDPNQTLRDVPLELDEAYDKEVWDWKWVDPSIVPVVNNTGYQVVLEKAYDDVIRTISLTVYKANPTVIEPTRKDLICNGQAQELVNAGSTVGGTLYYAVTDDNTAPADTAYTTSIPTGTDAGTYYVWYKVVGDENYNDTEAANITVTITDGPSFKLPAGLVAIGDSAFEGIPAVSVEITENVASIGARSFADCLNLTALVIPETVQSIDDTALEGSENVTVYGKTGSEAQRFAHAAGIKFVDPDALSARP